MKITLTSVEDKGKELVIEKVGRTIGGGKQPKLTEVVAQVCIGKEKILVDIDELVSSGIALAEPYAEVL